MFPAFLQNSRLVTAVLALALASGCSQRSSAPAANSQTDADQPAPRQVDNESNRLKSLFNVGGKQHLSGKDAPQLRDVAAEAGVRFKRFNDAVPKRYFLPEVMGGGVAWFDYDRDGFLDLYATDGCKLWEPEPEASNHFNRLFRNRDGERFDEVSRLSSSAENRYGQGCAVGDFNGDGFPDLYITNYGRNTLLVNRGDGTFADVTETAGVGDTSWGTSAVWFDADGDGDDDLYVANYMNVTRENHRVCPYGDVIGYCGPGQWKSGIDDVLYMNLGDGRFATAPKAEGAETNYAKGLAVAVGDFDDDARPEVYVANDMTPNFFLVRVDASPSKSMRGPLYRNIAETAGCALSGEGRNEASMGISCADFDGDGRVDVFLTHFYQQQNTLYRNIGSLRFEDDSRRSRIAATSFDTLGFGTVPFDGDLDGDDDLFIANGHVLGPEHTPYEMKPQLLINDGKARFDDVSARAGPYFTRPALGRGAAGGDYNNDGKVDLAVSHLDHPLAVLRNETRTPNAFIGFELVRRMRTSAVGGRIIVTTGARSRVIPIVGGGSYLSTSDSRIVVGLGRHNGRVQVTVVWPGGQRESFGDLSSHRYWLLREGQRALAAPVSAVPPRTKDDSSGQ